MGWPEELRKARAEFGMSLADLSREVGIPPGTISNWETRRNKPGYEKRVKLDEYLGIERERVSHNEAAGLEG